MCVIVTSYFNQDGYGKNPVAHGDFQMYNLHENKQHL